MSAAALRQYGICFQSGICWTAFFVKSGISVLAKRNPEKRPYDRGKGHTGVFREKREKYPNKYAKGHPIVYNGITHKVQTRKGGAPMRN